MTDQPLVAWLEIPVRDLAAGAAFYDAVFGYSTIVNRSGPRPSAVLNSMDRTGGAMLVEDTPGGGPVIHLALADTVEDGMARLEAAGGKVTSPVIEIPAGRFAYATDPDGNRLGLYQPGA